jgi:hypothetical protein
VLLDVQVLGLNTNSIEMFFDLISIKIRTRDLTVKGCGINQFIIHDQFTYLALSQQFLSDNMNIAEQNCGLHALIIDMWK